MAQTIKLKSSSESVWICKRGGGPQDKVLYRDFVYSGPGKLQLGKLVMMDYDHKRQLAAPVLNYPGEQYFVVISEISKLKVRVSPHTNKEYKNGKSEEVWIP